MTVRMSLASLASASGLLFLAACGGGGPVADHVPAVGIAPQAQEYAYPSTMRRDISYLGRRDYKEAMVLDCIEQNQSGCSVYGRGWFVRWSQAPNYVAIPNPDKGKGTYDEEDVIRRAVAIVNRSLPASKRLAVKYTNETFTGTALGTEVTYSHTRRVGSGEIHAEIWRYVDGKGAAGLGWTDGRKGFAFVHEDVMANPEYAVQTMVHEIMHALGLMGHPHHTHTSVLSYQHHSTVVFDNVPLVDMAVLYDMNGWEYWSGGIKTVIGTADGVQFGVHDLDFGAVLIPWVDAGYMPLPHVEALRGRASWTGTLVGKTAAFARNVHGVAELGVNFDNYDGWAKFHTIRRWDGTMWNQRGWSYDLYVNGYYFDSNDRDGIPDVVGAFYGAKAEVAAGTLQRSELTAAFGAEEAPLPVEPDEDDGTPEPEPTDEPVADERMHEPDDASSIQSTLQGLIDAADMVTDTSAQVPFFWSARTQNAPVGLSLSDLNDADELEYRMLTSRRGVSMARGERSSVVGDTTFSGLGYGGWLDHSFFLVTSSTIDGGNPLDRTESTFTHVYSLGDATGSNPVAGSATWSGVMAGIDIGGEQGSPDGTRGDLIAGDATLDIADFSIARLNLAFTNVTNLDTNGRLGDMRWSNISLNGGSFTASGLAGQFYGPNHEEVGGIFLRNQITGAFGARRQ